jgi:hypothetical protein
MWAGMESGTWYISLQSRDIPVDEIILLQQILKISLMVLLIVFLWLRTEKNDQLLYRFTRSRTARLHKTPKFYSVTEKPSACKERMYFMNIVRQ